MVVTTSSSNLELCDVCTSATTAGRLQPRFEKQLGVVSMEQEVDSTVPWDSQTQFECTNSSCYIRESVIPTLTWSLMIKAYMVSFLLLVSIVVWTAGDACFQYGRSYWECSTTSTLFSSYVNYTNLIHEFG